MSRMAMALAWSLVAVPAQAADIFTVAPDLWDRPRTARAVLDQPAGRPAITLYLSRPAAQLVIHHDYGQAPLLQAEELKSWLMALAVDSARIRLLNNEKPSEPLKIEVSQ
jgi:hypothetical protein